MRGLIDAAGAVPVKLLARSARLRRHRAARGGAVRRGVHGGRRRRTGMPYRFWAQYVAFLERKLRNMFLFTSRESDRPGPARGQRCVLRALALLHRGSALSRWAFVPRGRVRARALHRATAPKAPEGDRGQARRLLAGARQRAQGHAQPRQRARLPQPLFRAPLDEEVASSR